MMGLLTCQHAQIGQPGLTKTISGGEMKRLSVACGMATNPSFLFLDEPTSGLDTSLAHQVVSLLKQLSEQGTTVLCTIHQPSSEIFQMFDNLMLLSQGKRVFAGSLDSARAFFASQGLACHADYNPADHYIWQTSFDVTKSIDESTRRIDTLVNAFEASTIEENNRTSILAVIKTPPIITTDTNVFDGSYRQPGLTVQLKMLFWRAFKSKYQNKLMITLQLQQNIMTALIFGLVFLRIPHSTDNVPYNGDDRYALQGCSYVYIITNFFQHLYGVVFVFPQLKAIFKREVYDGTYGIGAAVAAHFFIDIPYFIVIPCITSLIVYFMAGFMSGGVVFVNIWCSLMGNIFCASALGYVISSLANSVPRTLLVLFYDYIFLLHEYRGTSDHDSNRRTFVTLFGAVHQGQSDSGLFVLDEVLELVLLRRREYIHWSVDLQRYLHLSARRRHTSRAQPANKGQEVLRQVVTMASL